MKYKISIIIPVYNAEKYISKCIESLINQTLKKIEIIIVNDGSKDNSEKIIKKYTEKFDNIKYIYQENKGTIEARNRGYKIATGEYIGFVDNDDFIEPTMYEKLYNLAISTNSDIAICNYRFYPKEVKKKKKWFNEYKGIIDWKFINRNNLIWNKIVKKELLDKMNITDLFKKIGEAAYTFVMLNTNKIVTTNEELYNYRVGHSSLSSNFNKEEWHIECAENSKIRREMVRNSYLEKDWGEYFDYNVFYNTFKVMLVAAYNNDEELYKKYKNEIIKYPRKGLIKEILNHDMGRLQSFAIRYIFTKNYNVSKLLSKLLKNG